MLAIQKVFKYLLPIKEIYFAKILTALYIISLSMLFKATFNTPVSEVKEAIKGPNI